MPAAAYVWVGFCAVEVPPSPKVHEREVIVPPVSVDVSTWTLVDDAFRARVRRLEPQLVFANEREREAFGELDATWIVKRGAEGVVVDDGEPFPPAAGEVVDTTGAGDALAAGFLVGGARLGVETAARCCARLGAMP